MPSRTRPPALRALAAARRSGAAAALRSGQILEAVRFAAAAFLRSERWDAAVPAALARLGRATGVEHVHLFTVCDAAQRVWASEAPAAGAPAQIAPQLGFERWSAALARGEVIHGRAGDFPGAEAAGLAQHGIRSIAVVPIFVGETLWGGMSLSDGARERRWAPAEIAALVAAADILGAAIERSTTQSALQESEERYRTLVAALAEGVVLQDRDGRILACNASAERVLGLSMDQLLSRRSADPRWRSVHEDGSPFPGETHPAMVTLRTCEPLANVVMGVHKPGGELTWLSVSTQPLVRPGERAPYAVVSSFFDITRQKRSEEELRGIQAELERRVSARTEELRRSSELLRTLFDGLDDGLLLLDGEGRVLAANHVLALLLGTTPEQLVGRLWLADPSGIAPAVAGQWALDALAAGAPCKRRGLLLLEDRAPRVLDVNVMPLRDDAPGAPRAVIHVTDVTERLQIEARALENERFAAGGKLASSVAHEINTPLQSIESLLYLLEVDPPEERGTYLRLAQQETERITRIVRQLLDLYRPAATNTPVSVNGLIERVMLLIDHALKRQRIGVQYLLAEELPPVLGRADQLTQVLLNLLMNALHAMPQGGRISIETAALPSGGAAEVAIVVRDTGAGIAPEHLPLIFEPFFTTRAEGTGLGLPLCAEIVAEHGGRITVESAPRSGSRFTVILPALAADGTLPSRSCP